MRRWFRKVRSVFFHNVRRYTSNPFRQPTNLKFYSHRNQYPKFRFVAYVVYYQTYNMATQRTQIKGSRQTYRKICAAIYLHPVALSFVNIIVAQIWLIATIFGLLMPLTCPLVAVVSAFAVAPRRNRLSLSSLTCPLVAAVALPSHQRSRRVRRRRRQSPSPVAVVVAVDVSARRRVRLCFLRSLRCL